MAQQLSLTQAIEELTTHEQQELLKVFQNPVVIKYFRAIGMQAVFEQAAYPYNKLHEANNLTFLLEMAYQKGIMHMADTILNYTPVKEPSNGTST